MQLPLRFWPELKLIISLGTPINVTISPFQPFLMYNVIGVINWFLAWVGPGYLSSFPQPITNSMDPNPTAVLMRFSIEVLTIVKSSRLVVFLFGPDSFLGSSTLVGTINFF